MRTLHAISAALIGVALTGGTASAASLTVADALGQFNAIVFGNLDGTSEIEGRTLVGGDITAPNSLTFNTRPTPASDFDELVVGGSIQGEFKNVNNGGDVTVGGTVNKLNLNGGGTLTTVGGVAPGGTVNGGTVNTVGSVMIPDLSSDFEALSAALSVLAGETPTTINGGQRGLFTTATPGSDGIAVYNTDVGFFNTISEFKTDLNGADTVVINVSGTDITLSDNNIETADVLGARVIFNFFEATTLTLSNKIIGTILAPLAHVTNTNVIEGNIVAKSLTLNGEVHLQAFSGTLPAVPLPPAAWLLLSGIGGMVLLRNRRAA